VTSWSLRARNADLTGGAFVDFSNATLVERHNSPDSFQVSGYTRDLAQLAVPGMGCTLADDQGVRRFSGPLTQIVRNGDGTMDLTWASDLIWLWGRICYPDPAHVITGQSTDTDERTGPAETVLLAFINANAGPGALAARRVPGLGPMPASLGRGPNAKKTAKLDVLGQLVADMAESAGVRVTVQQVGTALAVVVADAPDLSAWARYGPREAGGPGLLAEDWSYTISRPALNDAIVAGGGDGLLRVYRERTDADSATAWGGRIEQLVDSAQTVASDELDQAGDDALAAGAAPVEIKATVLDDPDLRIGVDVPMGAQVALDLDGDLIVERLRQVTTTIAVADGQPTVSVVPVIGSPDAALTQDQKAFLRMRRDLRKVVAYR
jgi:hypothetical protein